MLPDLSDQHPSQDILLSPLPVTIYSLLGTRDWCYETVMPDGGVEISLLGLESSCKYR